MWIGTPLHTAAHHDLRSNAIYESGEVGRLAPLPAIAEVWVKENPLVEELVDYRVDCFVEFAQEGRSVTLDGEAQVSLRSSALLKGYRTRLRCTHKQLLEGVVSETHRRTGQEAVVARRQWKRPRNMKRSLQGCSHYQSRYDRS